MSLVDRVAQVFAKTLNYDAGRFSPATVPEDVPGWDSVGHMNLVAKLEEEFGQQFEVDDIMEMSTGAKIVEILRAKGVEG
jgi:acyl carrier protein